MKSTLIVAAVAVLALVGMGAQAQTTPKIGWTNVDYILNVMPDSKKIQNELQIQKQQLEKVLQEKSKEFEDKYKAYEKNQATWSELIRADKEKELQGMNQSITELKQGSEQDLQNKYQKLVQPVLAKINEAINVVGKENGFTYILNMDAGANTTPIILYSGVEENNISNLILKKLGVEPPTPQVPQAVKDAAAAAATKQPAAAPASKPVTATPAPAPKKN
jgi:outer membrane protein